MTKLPTPHLLSAPPLKSILTTRLLTTERCALRVSTFGFRRWRATMAAPVKRLRRSRSVTSLLVSSSASQLPLTRCRNSCPCSSRRKPLLPLFFLLLFWFLLISFRHRWFLLLCPLVLRRSKGAEGKGEKGTAFGMFSPRSKVCNFGNLFCPQFGALFC